jgi:dTDP-4-dehydrorhamnose reductase
MTERWLLTGGTGQVGLALRRNPPLGVEIVAPGRGELDVADLPPLKSFLEGVSAIVNCAAYTAVDKAESDIESAMLTNLLAPGILGEAAAHANIPVIHVSTDYVFGPGEGPWIEESPKNAIGIYGITKAAGENALRNSGARYAVVRTAWVISADGHNFVKTMLRLGTERDVLRVVADQHGTPTHAGDLAAALTKVTQRFTSDHTLPSGIWHCTNAGETTWHGLATRVFATAARLGLRVPTVVEAITTADYPTPAPRPADSRLDCGKLARDFGIALRPWQEAVDEIVAELAQQGQIA